MSSSPSKKVTETNGGVVSVTTIQGIGCNTSQSYGDKLKLPLSSGDKINSYKSFIFYLGNTNLNSFDQQFISLILPKTKFLNFFLNCRMWNNPSPTFLSRVQCAARDTIGGVQQNTQRTHQRRQ